MAAPREVVEGPLEQGVDEEKVYSLTSTNGTPTSPTVVVKDWSAAAHTAVTATVMPTGSASIAGNVITLPKLKLLTAGVVYRVEVKYTAAGNVLEDFFYVRATE